LFLFTLLASLAVCVLGMRMAYRCNVLTVVWDKSPHRDIACPVTLRAVPVALDNILAVHDFVLACSPLIALVRRCYLFCERRGVNLSLSAILDKPLYR
jgi:hypothetical protein